ncbi:MAG: hypothetical protein GWO24_24540 [Akkermansiaceae bacterium]|nr:hypothetical protein [Akkermansiaceae bacterium]
MNRAQSAGSGGFALLEVVLALLLFAIVGTSLSTALNSVGRIAGDARREMSLTRLIDSELRAAMSLPQLEEGVTTKVLDEKGIEIETLIEPLEEIENENGQILQQMFRIQVKAVWWENNDWQEVSAETWRYERLYQQ